MERDQELSRYPVYVSKAYADNSRALRDIPYTALVKIVDAGDYADIGVFGCGK